MSALETMILYTFILSGLFRVSTQSGGVEVWFVRYSDTCMEHFSTNACDPKFSFCLSTPQTGRLTVDNCNYASTGASSDHFHNTNNIDMEHMTNIKGHPNPWIVTVHRFLDPLVMLVIRATDVDVFSEEEMQTWATVLNETIWATKEQSVWTAQVMSQNSYTMWFRVRMYCDANYYTTSCDVLCVADNSSSGHYVCEAGTGRKICLPGWQGVQCTEDVDECALSYCHSGECINLPGDYNCSCPENYTGKNCSVPANPCRFNPCQNGGTCVELSPAFSCLCPEAWTGDTCNTSTDVCQSLPCLNNASCSNSPNSTGYICTCLYPYAGDRCQVQDSGVWTTANTTRVETMSSFTFTQTPSTPTETSSPGNETSSPGNETSSPGSKTSSTSTLTTFTSDITKSELSPPTITSTKEPLEKVKSTASEKSVANVELVNQKEEDSHFEPWYVAVIVGVVFIAIVIALVVFIMKRRRHSKHQVTPPSVYFNGTSIMFQNGVYADVNRSNAQIERQSRELPAVPTTATTPTEDGRFNPASPTSQEEPDDRLAVGICASNQSERQKAVIMDPPTLTGRPASERMEGNLYADFQSLTDGQKTLHTSGTHEGRHYDALHEGTSAVPRDSETDEYSDLIFNLDSQSAPVVTMPATPYDIPSNNSSYYSTPPTRSPMLQPQPDTPDPGTPLRGSAEIGFSKSVLGPAPTQVTSVVGEYDGSHDVDRRT